MPGAGGLDCPLTITAPAMQPRFGNALLVADVNGDGKKDLLVGAPPTRAYLYTGPFTAGAPPAPAKEFKHPTLLDTQALGDFGFRVGAVDIDGMPGLEVLVSAPDLPAGGEPRRRPGVRLQAGRHPVVAEPSTTTRPAPTPRFGFSIQGIRFTPARRLRHRPPRAAGRRRPGGVHLLPRPRRPGRPPLLQVARQAPLTARTSVSTPVIGVSG